MSLYLVMFLVAVSGGSEAAVAQLRQSNECFNPQRISMTNAYTVSPYDRVDVPAYAETTIACDAQNNTAVDFVDIPINTFARQIGRWELFVGLSKNVVLILDDGTEIEPLPNTKGLTMYRYSVTRFPKSGNFVVYDSSTPPKYSIPAIFTTNLYPVTLSKTPAITATTVAGVFFIFFMAMVWQIRK